jgi:hypothetical protein
VDNPTAKVLLTRSCVYEGDIVASFDIDVLENSSGIDDELKRTILGERQTILFVEGVEHSLDKPLYSLLFPSVSIVAKANCRDVEHAVVSIRDMKELTWVKAFGLVDNDASEMVRIEALQNKGVIALSVYSVESIYYHPEVQKLVGEKNHEVVGGDLKEMLLKAHNDAVQAIKDKAAHLSVKIAEKSARAEIFLLLPKKGEVAKGGERTATIDFADLVHDETTHINNLISDSNFLGLLRRYPVRESSALDAIAKALKFANRTLYEAAVRNLLVRDADAVLLVRNLLGTLPDELIT